MCRERIMVHGVDRLTKSNENWAGFAISDSERMTWIHVQFFGLIWPVLTFIIFEDAPLK